MADRCCEGFCLFSKDLAKDSGKQCQVLAFSTYMGGGGTKIGRGSLYVVMNAFQFVY